jgi:GcrA cell cycle regulator
MPKATPSLWTEKKVEILKAFWHQESASEIAKTLGLGFTRYSVIGKAHRLGLARKAKPWSRERRAVYDIRTSS